MNKNIKNNNSPTISAKIIAIQNDIKGIVKLSYNSFQKYYYFTELQILNLLKPLLQKHQLALMASDDSSQPFCHEKEGNMHLVKYLKKMVISDGENSLEFSFWACGSNQDLAKAKGAAETYAMKHLLSKFFLIPIQDEEESSNHLLQEENSIETIETIFEEKEFSPLIKDTIRRIRAKTDKSGNKYLLITLDQLDKNVFVFPYKVPEGTWNSLQEGSAYEFTLEEKTKSILILLAFRFAE